MASLPNCASLLKEALTRASSVRVPGANKRFTLRALRTHWEAELRCHSLYRRLQNGGFCTCVCTCGAICITLCKCCTGDCKRRQVERFEKGLADLSPSFIGPPPSVRTIACQYGGIKRR